MTDLNSDQWIKENSQIQAEKIHAIGVISFQWNQCEFWLFQLFCYVSGLQEQTAWALVFDLGDVAICTRISTLMELSKLPKDSAALIENALEFYDRCRQNRNSVVHAWTRGTAVHIKLARKSKKPDEVEPSAFPCELEDIRRVAEEVQAITRRLWILVCMFLDGSIPRGKTSLKTLPLPELLWKPPQQGSTRPKRQP